MRVSAKTNRLGGWPPGPARPPGRPPGRNRGRVDVRERPGSEPDHEQPNQFAVLLNHLFATRLTPEGRHYTLTEVSKATGLSVPYLSILLKGGIDAVPFQRVVILARFFQVPLDYSVVSLNCRDEFGCFLSVVAFSMKYPYFLE